jgi:hypothetical protein
MAHTHKEDIVVLQCIHDLPEFGQVKDIVIEEDQRVAFVVNILQTECFNYHYHSYEVTDSGEFRLVRQDQLIDFHPLCLHQFSVLGVAVKSVQLKYNVIL